MRVRNPCRDQIKSGIMKGSNLIIKMGVCTDTELVDGVYVESTKKDGSQWLYLYRASKKNEGKSVESFG